MLKTGKPVQGEQAFHRRLLSEYIAEYTLDNYVAYFELKPILKEIEKLLMETKKRTHEVLEELRRTGSNLCSPRTDSPLVVGSLESPSKPFLDPHTDINGRGNHDLSRVRFGIPRPSSVSAFSTVLSPTSSTIATEEVLLMDPVLVRLKRQRETLEDLFIKKLEESYHKVKNFLITLEKSIMVKLVELHKLAEADIRDNKSPCYIPDIYLNLECVTMYRQLNLLAFRKILRKCLERCACNNLGLQKRVWMIDDVISKSNVSQPLINLRDVALEIIVIYGTVYRYTYEEAVSKLKQYVCRNGMLTPRILPNCNTFFFADTFPHKERLDTFSIRVLAGTRSLFTEKMITEALQCQRYPGTICGRFANGEISITLRNKLRGDDVFIVQSMVSSAEDNLTNSGAVMELLLMIHTAQLAAASRITAVIPYLAYTRNVASIAALAEMIEIMGCKHVITLDMPIEQVEGMFSIPLENISAKYEFVSYITNSLRDEGHDFRNITIVAPTGSFVGRAKDFADAMMRYGALDSATQFVSVCTAVKRVQPYSFLEGVNNTSHGDGGRSVPETEVRDPPEEISLNGSVCDTLLSAGGASRARTMVKALSTNTLMGMEKALRCQKEGSYGIVTQHLEESHDEHENIFLVGDVANRLCIIVDTVLDEGVNVLHVAKSLHAQGAQRILLVATHAILSGGWRERMLAAPIERIIVTDSITHYDIMRDPLVASKFRMVPISPLLARAIEKIHTENTLPALFEK